jgi:DNA-binding transcriptional regulator YiaG
MYHYTQCGLDNVWLENGFTVKNTPYGKGISIEDAVGLHQVLALDLTKKKGSITGKELRFLRVAIGLSQEGLGRLLGATEQSVSLWERTGKVPKNSDSLTRMLVSEKLNGNCKVTEVIERINTVERMCNQRIVARETKHKWRAKHEAAESNEGLALTA